MYISEHFSYLETISSAAANKLGIDNTPSFAVLETILKVAPKLEKVRSVLGHPMHIDSWYRNESVNKVVGGSTLSQHMNGEAVDFICPAYGDPLAICKAIINYQDLIPFDQLILEHTWVHISFAILSGKPRGQVLSLLANKHYAPGLTDVNGNSLV